MQPWRVSCNPSGGTRAVVFKYPIRPVASSDPRKQVARELDTLKAESERASECLRESRFGNAGNILDKQVAAGEKAGDGELHSFGFADDDFANLSGECIEPIFHAKTIRRIDAVRKPS